MSHCFLSAATWPTDSIGNPDCTNQALKNRSRAMAMWSASSQSVRFAKRSSLGIARLRKIDDVVQHALIGQRLHANRGSFPRQADREPVDHHLRVVLLDLSLSHTQHVAHEGVPLDLIHHAQNRSTTTVARFKASQAVRETRRGLSARVASCWPITARYS